MIELLPYQKKCFWDRPRFKALCWCRGARKTFTVTLEIVADCLQKEADGSRTTWVILSRGDRQALEAIQECKRHCRALLLPFRGDINEFISEDGMRRYTQHVIRFPNGSKIIALPANPDTARGYTANVYLDEFCIHIDDIEIWRAMLPVLRGRFRVIVSSTPKGGRNRVFYKIMHDQTGTWSHHIVDIYEAVRQGLPIDIEKERAAMSDPDGWAQEFELQWLDEASAWLSYELIESCEHHECGEPSDYMGGPCYVGNDIAVRHDLWVAWVVEQIGDVFWTREVSVMHRAKFAEHASEMRRLFSKYQVVRACIDQTGMGEKVVEDYEREWGSRIEGTLFSQAKKLDIASIIKDRFERRTVRIPSDPSIRNDLYSLKRDGQRFDVDKSAEGHGDRFWALGLSLYAAKTRSAYNSDYRIRPSNLDFSEYWSAGGDLDDYASMQSLVGYLQ